MASPNAAVKAGCVVAGMVAGADSIDDLDALRHGGIGKFVTGDAGVVDRRDVPAHIHPRAHPSARRRLVPGPGRSRVGGAAVASANGCDGIRRCRRHDLRGPRLQEARRRVRVLRRERPQRAAGGAAIADVGPGDRGLPAAAVQHDLWARRREADRGRSGHRPPGWGERAGDGPGRLGPLRARAARHIHVRVIGRTVDDVGLASVRYANEPLVAWNGPLGAAPRVIKIMSTRSGLTCLQPIRLCLLGDSHAGL